MRWRGIVVCIVLAAAASGTWVGIAQSDGGALPPLEQRLAKLADQMRLGLSIASVAVFSPTVGDARGQAQQLILLLRGDPGRFMPGLVPQATSFPDWIEGHSLGPEVRLSLLNAATNVRALLELALEEAVSANHSRTLVKAKEDLLGVYALLLAAWGEPVDGVGIPGLVMILRSFAIPLTV
jgi:hypothetical protein